MSHERSDQTWESWRQSNEKYDYFMAGLSTALTAFIAQGLPASPLIWSPTLLEAASVALLCGSVAAALYRIRLVITGIAANQQVIYYGERRALLAKALAESQGPLVINRSTGETFQREEAPRHLAHFASMATQYAAARDPLERRAEKAYRVRDALLVIGVVLYAAARIWGAYV